MPRRPKEKTSAEPSLKQQVLVLYRLIALCCLGGLISWFLFLTPSAPIKRVIEAVTTPRNQPLQGVTVILDPGHGGTDSGYRRKECREDALNYRFTATLAHVLQASGATILYTVRSAALEIPLEEGKAEPPLMIPRDAVLVYNNAAVHGGPDYLHRRAASVRPAFLALAPEKRAAAKGLYFLAIHHDAIGVRRVNGGHVLYDRRDGGPPRFALVLGRRLSEANLSRKRYDGQLPNSDARALGVLNPLYNPIPQRVLLEVATITNPQDRAKALTPQWRWQFAHLITEAIIECER